MFSRTPLLSATLLSTVYASIFHLSTHYLSIQSTILYPAAISQPAIIHSTILYPPIIYPPISHYPFNHPHHCPPTYPSSLSTHHPSIHSSSQQTFLENVIHCSRSVETTKRDETPYPGGAYSLERRRDEAIKQNI